MTGIGQDRIKALRESETEAVCKARPKTAAKLGNGIAGFLDGVPMHWMKDWPTPFHNMMLVSPATRPAQVNRLIRAFSDVVKQLTD